MIRPLHVFSSATLAQKTSSTDKSVDVHKLQCGLQTAILAPDTTVSNEPCVQSMREWIPKMSSTVGPKVIADDQAHLGVLWRQRGRRHRCPALATYYHPHQDLGDHLERRSDLDGKRGDRLALVQQ